MKPTRRKSKFAVQEDSDPLSVVVNLFDVAMVFAVALMVAMVMHMNMTEVFTQEDFTVVKNPGKENMEIIMKEGNKINKYTPSEQQGSGAKGKRVGIAYELENGEISREEYDEWRYKYPKLDTYQKRAKVPSQELSDYLLKELTKKEK